MTAIDIEVRLISICDMVSYVPRAAAVGFLAPFPGDWLALGRSGLTAFLVGAEMSLIYLALIGILVTLPRTSPTQALPLIVFSVTIVVALVIAIPNIGTLYRMRMAYLLPIIGIGLATLLDGAWKRLR